MSTNPRMHNDMYFPRGSEEFAGLRLAFKGPLANDVGVVRASGPSRVTAQEIAARFPSADIGLPGHPSIIIESINSNSSAKRCPNTDTMGTHGGKVMHMPARTRRTHISAMEVASSDDVRAKLFVRRCSVLAVMATKPTLLQYLFNQPSQKYSLNSPNSTSALSVTSVSALDASQKTHVVADESRALSSHPSPTASIDSDTYFTPSSSPTCMSPEPAATPPRPVSRSSSSASSLFEDGTFSSRSAITSVTSLSSTASLPRNPDQLQRRASSHGTARAKHPDWAKDVRWLVPPEHPSSSSSSSSFKDLNLVGVEYTLVRPKSRSRPKARVPPGYRMSALWEEEEDDESSQRSPTSQNNIPTRAHTIPNARRPRPTSIISRSSSTSTTRTVTLPTPLPVSSGLAVSTNGYTGLTLPRAAYKPSKHPDRVSSSVDITRSGLAQTTMSTITITRRPVVDPNTPVRLRATLPSPLSFSAHTSPPSKVNSNQILVQVWRVGLDALDAIIVDERARKNHGLGFVPGRSFVGRAVECGWDVNNISKGDWVFGITEVRKSGALAEFIVVDRRRIHRAPRPSPKLTLDQIALLPLSGLPAHRAVRTLSHLPHGSRALVLHAHAGAGLLALQELTELGFSLTAHVPGTWSVPGVRRAREAGARDVRCGEAVDIVRDIQGEEFDAVVDPLGGKEVWDACRRVLRTAGQFTTLVGDTASDVPSANAHFKSNMRSLRRAFVKKDRKSVGYQWVSPAADVDSGGEDVCHSLAAVARLATEGVLVPYANGTDAEDESGGYALPFELASEAFEVDAATGRCMLSRGGTAVIRIVD
ncbi:hypothetical protein K439DRAFT_1504853 [Ramaria rubella]|nr:hypothetical protein K439DRAFT_1504853 [Ramaria rubella]